MPIFVESDCKISVVDYFQTITWKPHLSHACIYVSGVNYHCDQQKIVGIVVFMDRFQFTVVTHCQKMRDYSFRDQSHYLNSIRRWYKARIEILFVKMRCMRLEFHVIGRDHVSASLVIPVDCVYRRSWHPPLVLTLIRNCT